eukprot:gene4448-5637_t
MPQLQDQDIKTVSQSQLPPAGNEVRSPLPTTAHPITSSPMIPAHVTVGSKDISPSSQTPQPHSARDRYHEFLKHVSASATERFPELWWSLLGVFETAFHSLPVQYNDNRNNYKDVKIPSVEIITNRGTVYPTPVPATSSTTNQKELSEESLSLALSPTTIDIILAAASLAAHPPSGPPEPLPSQRIASSQTHSARESPPSSNSYPVTDDSHPRDASNQYLSRGGSVGSVEDWCTCYGLGESRTLAVVRIRAGPLFAVGKGQDTADYALSEGIRAAMAMASGGSPTVLLLEDLHALCPSTRGTGGGDHLQNNINK